MYSIDNERSVQNDVKHPYLASLDSTTSLLLPSFAVYLQLFTASTSCLCSSYQHFTPPFHINQNNVNPSPSLIVRSGRLGLGRLADVVIIGGDKADLNLQ